MALHDYIKKIPAVSMDDYRMIADEPDRDPAVFIDVRQPDEFEKEHMPDALSMPLTRFVQGMEKLESDRKYMLCCSNGIRSCAAAAMMINAGYGDVSVLDGGLRGWRNETLQSVPQRSMVMTGGIVHRDELVSIAWALEEGVRRFYRELCYMDYSREITDSFRRMGMEGERHEKLLEKMFRRMHSEAEAGRIELKRRHLIDEETENFIEKGMCVNELVKWAKNQLLNSVLEFSISLEFQLYDLFSFLRRNVNDRDHRRYLDEILGDEKEHYTSILKVFLARI